MALRNPTLGARSAQRIRILPTVSPANGCRRCGVRGRAESVGIVLISTASSPHEPPRDVWTLSISWKGCSHVRWFVEEVPAGAA
jgi:hypothetical protein